MPAVETTVTVSIGPEGMTLEAQIARAVQQAGRQQSLEAEYLQAHGFRLRRVKQGPLDLLTRFGWTRLNRWRMRDPAGKYVCPLDGLLHLPPRQHASPLITTHAVALASRSLPG